MTLLTAQTLGVSVLFLFPNFKAGQFGGIFPLQGTAATLLPEKGSGPIAYNNGKFWLVNTNTGIYAIYKVCTHLGCLYAWQPVTHRFECPCHGSKFNLNGSYVAGPAPRSLDRFKIIATRPDGTVIETPPDGAGIELNGDETLAVDTGTRIKLPGRVEV
jgi:cytochrome b6-f complex iron-sulfur subunit